jgi:hypothetical protein
VPLDQHANLLSINDYKRENNLTISLTDDTDNTARRCTPMFLIGVIAGMGVFILVDTGVMHNIIYINVARAIGLREQRIDTTILIGSGTKVTCRAASFSTPLRIDNEVYTIDVFLLNISDINIVLGTPWLASLQHLTWDFTSMEL